MTSTLKRAKLFVIDVTPGVARGYDIYPGYRFKILLARDLITT